MEGMHNFGDEQLRMHSLCIGAQLSKRSALMHSPSSHSVLTGKVRPRSGGKSGVMERMMDMTPRKLDGLRENIRQGRSRDNTGTILRCMDFVIKSLPSSSNPFCGTRRFAAERKVAPVATFLKFFSIESNAFWSEPRTAAVNEEWGGGASLPSFLGH